MDKIKWYKDGEFREELVPKKTRIDPKIVIKYNGKYPCLCSGTLIVKVDDVEYIFPSHSLSSGGSVWFDNNWSEQVEEGPWSVNSWPKDFPEELKDRVLSEINSSIRWGCCGGCV